jgi:hypothetical protein
VFYQSIPSAGAFGAFLALKLSRSQRLSQGNGAVHSQHLSIHVDGARRTPNIFFIRLAWHCDGNDRINTSGDTSPRRTLRAGGRGVRYARTIVSAHHVS